MLHLTVDSLGEANRLEMSEDMSANPQTVHFTTYLVAKFLNTLLIFFEN